MATAFRCLTLLAAAVPLAAAADTKAALLATQSKPSNQHSHLAETFHSHAASGPIPPTPGDADTPAAPTSPSRSTYQSAHGMHATGESSSARVMPATPPAAAPQGPPVATGNPVEQDEEDDIGLALSGGVAAPAARAPAPADAPDPAGCSDIFVDPAVYAGILETYSATLQQMVAVACGAAWAGLPGDLAALAAPWALTWSQITGATDDNCSETLTPPGSAATGCAWSEASAYAAAFALADVHSAAAAAAFAEHCTPRCAADEATSWGFAQPETTLLVLTSAYAAATDAACAAGQTSSSASEWSLCYSGVLGDTLTVALLRSLHEEMHCFGWPLDGAVERGLEALEARGRHCLSAHA